MYVCIYVCIPMFYVTSIVNNKLIFLLRIVVLCKYVCIYVCMNMYVYVYECMYANVQSCSYNKQSAIFLLRIVDSMAGVNIQGQYPMGVMVRVYKVRWLT